MIDLPGMGGGMPGMGFLQMLLGSMGQGQKTDGDQAGPTDAPGPMGAGAAPAPAGPPDAAGMGAGAIGGGGNTGGGSMGGAAPNRVGMFSKPVAGAMGSVGDSLMTASSSTQQRAAPGAPPQARPIAPFQPAPFVPPGGVQGNAGAGIGPGGPLMSYNGPMSPFQRAR